MSHFLLHFKSVKLFTSTITFSFEILFLQFKKKKKKLTESEREICEYGYHFSNSKFFAKLEASDMIDGRDHGFDFTSEFLAF